VWGVAVQEIRLGKIRVFTRKIALELAEGVLSGGCVRRGCAGNPPGKI